LTDKPGKFQNADSGTLFLDEIGDMSPMTQAKVLRALEEGEIQPVGSTESVRTDIRVLTATNKDLEEAISTGCFREDLYFRLNVVHIHLPPLQDRKDDIPFLTKFFMRFYCDEFNKQQKLFTRRALEILVKQDWTGNIRELRNFIERVVVFASDDVIDLPHIKILLEKLSVESNLTLDLSLRDARRQFERDYINAKLIANDWNIPETAQALGIARTALYRKMKILNIDQSH